MAEACRQQCALRSIARCITEDRVAGQVSNINEELAARRADGRHRDMPDIDAFGRLIAAAAGAYNEVRILALEYLKNDLTAWGYVDASLEKDEEHCHHPGDPCGSPARVAAVALYMAREEQTLD